MPPKDTNKGKADKDTSGSKKNGNKKKDNEVPQEVFLAKFRPKQRSVFYMVYLGICAGSLLFYDTCDVRKKKQDCGHPGISPFECRTTACFLKGGGDMDTKKVTITRKKGIKFGLASGSQKGDRDVFIKELKEGAITAHNAQADPEDRIYPRDTIVSIDGATGSSLVKKLKATDTEKAVIEFKRSQLPSYLRWLHRSSKPNMLEKLLTAPGTQNWFKSFYKLGGLGFTMWYLSGYSAMSLPLYYFGTSGFVAWNVNRCCHDSKVNPGVAHCYKGGSANLTVAMNRIKQKAESQLKAFQKQGPRNYLKGWFWSNDFSKWL